MHERRGLRSGKNSNRLHDGDKSAAGHTWAPRAREFRPKPTERSNNVLVSSLADHAPFVHPPPSSPRAARARTYRRLSPPPCSLSLLSRCLTFFPLHHLILRPDPFPDRSSSSGGRTLPVVLIDNSRVSVKRMFVCVCVCFSLFEIFLEISRMKNWLFGENRELFSFLSRSLENKQRFFLLSILIRFWNR